MPHILVQNAVIEFPIEAKRTLIGRSTPAGHTGGKIDANRGVIRALDNINLDIKHGDRLGLMGHNGAGKSTMLRMLSGAYVPVRGRIKTSGRISTLFNSTPGLDIDQTGRENIITCSLYLGMSRAQANAKLEEIIDFADLGDYIDLPVRIYSAGMVTRLGFSLATAVDPEILLLDEGLATGDANFARKAERKMQELIEKSSILIIASHSLPFLQAICNKCVLLEHGQILLNGGPDEVADYYMGSVVKAAEEDDVHSLERAYHMATEMVKNGILPPSALEEQALRWALRIQPDDLAMLKRFGQLRRSQGKDVDPETQLRTCIQLLKTSPEDESILQQMDELAETLGQNLPLELKPGVEAARQKTRKVAL